ncbi:MAG: hypothetical protein ACE5HE_00790 [Phycisphaerae bacterium]
MQELERIVSVIHRRWPQGEIVIRGDANFCREPISAPRSPLTTQRAAIPPDGLPTVLETLESAPSLRSVGQPQPLPRKALTYTTNGFPGVW